MSLWLLWYIEVLDNIYSLLKQNIKSCNAKRRRQRGLWKTTIGLISKKSNFARAAHFFCTFLAVVLHDYNVKLPETSWLPLVTRFMEEMYYVFLFAFCFHCRSFSPWWQLAFLTFLPPLQNFHVVPPTKNVSLVFFISCSSSLSLFFSLSFAGLLPTCLIFSVFLFLYVPNLWTR